MSAVSMAVMLAALSAEANENFSLKEVRKYLGR